MKTTTKIAGNLGKKKRTKLLRFYWSNFFDIVYCVLNLMMVDIDCLWEMFYWIVVNIFNVLFDHWYVVGWPWIHFSLIRLRTLLVYIDIYIYRYIYRSLCWRVFQVNAIGQCYPVQWKSSSPAWTESRPVLLENRIENGQGGEQLSGIITSSTMP